MSGPRVALVHNIVPPYRVSLFNEIAQHLADFKIFLERRTHPHRRAWAVDEEDWKFDHSLFRSVPLNSRRTNYAGDIGWDVGRQLAAFRPDVLVVNGWSSPVSWQAVRWGRRRGLPMIGWFESSRQTGKHRGTITQRMRASFVRTFDCALVPGSSSEAFLREMGFDGRLFVMPNSVDDNQLRVLARAAEPGGPALFIGELSSRKGFDLVLSATDEIASVTGGLDVCGDGPLREQVRAVTNDAVRYLGNVQGDARVSAFERAAVVLLPSRFDPWPLVAVEALVAGRRLVLGSGVASASDLVCTGPFVQQMSEASSSALLTALCRVQTHEVPGATATMFTPPDSASAFVQACAHAAIKGGPG